MLIENKWLSSEKLNFQEKLAPNLMIEYRQCLDEGKDVTAYKPLLEAVVNLQEDNFQEDMADIIYQKLLDIEVSPDFPYYEPSDLRSIQNSRPDERKVFTSPAVNEKLRQKIAGAWYGRVSGCLLGKPIEGWHTPEIKKLLQKTDNYPLKNYIVKNEAVLNELKKDADRCWIDTLQGSAPSDDDTNYTVMAALLVERCGRKFTPEQVGQTWLDSQPKSAYFTAERVAFRNLLMGIMPPLSALYKNPCREWIGAQIRADYYGYINPGAPEAAAEMAWRDASISHVKNGIYGEMLVAAMLAAAAVSDDINEIIMAGLEQIPEKCRLAKDIKQVQEWHKQGASIKDCYERIHEKFDEKNAHDWCHTNSNAMIVVAALLYGEKDYSRSICLAVEAGFDTDCNGATVGSIIGMIIGLPVIPEKWTLPYKGTLQTSIMGAPQVKIDDMIDLTMKHINTQRAD